MADIQLTWSDRKRTAVFQGQSPEGIKFLEKTFGTNAVIRPAELAEDIITYIKNEGFIVDEV